MALPEQLEIFRAYVVLMATAPDDPTPEDALDRLHEAVREGEAARVARELRGR